MHDASGIHGVAPHPYRTYGCLDDHPRLDERIPTRRRRALLLLNVIGGSAVLASYVLWLGHPSNHAGRFGAVYRRLAASLHDFHVRGCPRISRALPYLARYVIGPRMAAYAVRARPLPVRAYGCPSPSSTSTADHRALDRAALRSAHGCRASVALVVLIARTPTSAPARTRALALAGSMAFAFQTAVLDAFFWPALFPG